MEQEQKLDYEHRLTAVEDRSKSNAKRLDEMKQRQDTLDELVGTVKALAIREENVENDVKEIKVDVKTLTMKPAKRWDNAIDYIIVTIIAAVIGFVIAKL